MKELARILVPIDFSSDAKAALGNALDVAETYGAEIDLLHVIPPPSYIPLERTIFGEEKEHTIDELMRESAEAELQKIVDRLDDEKKAKVTTHLEMGVPSETIVRYAKTHDADLIVMGTSGRSKLEQLVVGSVTQRVTRGAPCPVLVVRGAQ